MTEYVEYVLDCAKWRSGGSLGFRTGKGFTAMENSEGYSCCLGQFAKQFGVDSGILMGCSNPAHVANAIGNCYDENFVVGKYDNGSFEYDSSELARCLILINDYELTTPRKKIQQIKRNLESHGHTLKVINEEVLDEM